MRHLHFVQSIEPLQGGGLGKAALELHRAFIGRDHHSTLVTTCGATVEDGLPHVHQFERRGPAKAYFSPDLLRTADSLVSTADVVHGHGFYVAPNWILGRGAVRHAKPLVYHAHGFFDPWILSRSSFRKKLAHLLFEDANFRHARLWRALTPKEADQIRAQGVRAPIVVAPNGLDLRPFDIPVRFLEKPKRRLLFLGRLHPKKGLDLLLEVWAQIKPVRADWELILAGPDEGGFQSFLVRRCVDLDVADTVSFPGVVTGTAKTALIKSADVFVLPSYSEGFPVAVLEALACSVPVVATSQCNFPEMREAGAGWECPAEPAGLARALTEAFRASPDERRERGYAGRRLIETRYDWPAIARVILDAADRCCD